MSLINRNHIPRCERLLRPTEILSRIGHAVINSCAAMSPENAPEYNHARAERQQLAADLRRIEEYANIGSWPTKET